MVPELQKVVDGNKFKLDPILFWGWTFPPHAWSQKPFVNSVHSRKQSPTKREISYFLCKELSESTFTQGKRFSLYYVAKMAKITMHENLQEIKKNFKSRKILVDVMQIPPKVQQCWEIISVITCGMETNYMMICSDICVVIFDYTLYNGF